jgi:MoaA/NifB/PqqE/SkfB family radical SAM enzyme
MIITNNGQERIGLLGTVGGMRLAQEDFLEAEELKDDITIEPERRRLYVVTSYECDGACRFCLIRHDKCDERPLGEAVERACAESPSSVSVSITGGEPLLNPNRVHEVASAVKRSTQPRWLGIATNGLAYRDISRLSKLGLPLKIYISRHGPFRVNTRLMGRAAKGLGVLVSHYKRYGAEVMLTCTTTRTFEPARYCVMASSNGVTRVCFRELSRCLDGAYGGLGKKYNEWRRGVVLPTNELSRQLSDNSHYHFQGQTVRPYIYHEYWIHEPTGVEICLRRVDERELAGWTDNEKVETVVYPDGKVSSGWGHSKEKEEPNG